MEGKALFFYLITISSSGLSSHQQVYAGSVLTCVGDLANCSLFLESSDKTFFAFIAASTMTFVIMYIHDHVSG